MQKTDMELGTFTYFLVPFVRRLSGKASIHTTGPMLLVKRKVAFMGP